MHRHALGCPVFFKNNVDAWCLHGSKPHASPSCNVRDLIDCHPAPKVLQFMGAVIEDDCMLLISEFMHRGSLFDAIAKDKTGQLSWYNRGRLIALDIVRGMTLLLNSSQLCDSFQLSKVTPVLASLTS